MIKSELPSSSPQCNCGVGEDNPAFHSEDCPRRGWCPTCSAYHDEMAWHHLGMLCGRCSKHTENNNQGHYWALCQVKLAELKAEDPAHFSFSKALTDYHFCCPGDCELEAKKGMTTAAPLPVGL